MAKKMKVDDIKANQEKQNAEIKIAKIAMMIISLFLLSWCPYATVALIGQFGPSDWVTPFLAELPVMLAKASAMHNPIVYALNHPKFREALYNKAPWIFCCCDPPKLSASQSESQIKKHTKVSRAVSGDSDVVGGNFSDMSSCVSNLSDSAYGASVEMRKIRHDNSIRKPHEYQESSFGSPSTGYDNVLIRDLVQALVGVASAQNRGPSVIQPVYLPSGGASSEQAGQGDRQGVYVVDNGKQVDISAYLAQLAAAGGIACATSKDKEQETSEDKKEKEGKKEEPIEAKEGQSKENKEGAKEVPVGDPNV
ncbi:hypothetical protein FSP39_008490 [Pinctada imbricata]|uniref:G-protein coupled receptors family 1 profile domain-containing protein n=1 Tax=Pinctada imbricata TaxID=66713 RepID=A0AA89C0W1_PINIB|nr:hypothetical protein FSP39_008490 [Pinctada imbricata]